MFTEHRGSTLDLSRAFLKVDRHSGHTSRTDHRMIDLLIHLHRGDLRIIEEFRPFADRTTRNTLRHQKRLPLSRGLLTNQWLENRSKLCGPRSVLFICVVTRISGQIGYLEYIAEHPPELVCS